VTAVVAHRGAHLEHRENTLDAFRAAVALGVDGVELDVRRTLDGVLVVHHDPSIGGRAIAVTPSADLPGHVPALAAAMEVLSAVAVNVEIKNSPERGEGPYDDSGELARQVLDLLHDVGPGAGFVVSCFDLRTCVHAREHDGDVPVAWLVGHGSLGDALSEAHRRGLAAVNPHYRLVDAAGVARARSLGLEVNAWTVNRGRDLAAVAALGVTSVITDRPARALAIYGRGPA
jgi:glycerophosphoryl diester phosphodiesterase